MTARQPSLEARTERFPLGAAVMPAALEADPYPILAALRKHEPISWVPSLSMWVVTGYDDVQRLLLDDERLTTTSERSPIVDTFGRNMLTCEGPDHVRYRRALQPTFMMPNIRQSLEPAIAAAARRLIADLDGQAVVELRGGFAARLPVQVILLTFGLPLSGEPLVRHWYDDFERALANYEGDAEIRRRAATSVAEFRAFLEEAVEASRDAQAETLLGRLASKDDGTLSVPEIIQNLLIVLFGGISTVEALVLNAVWALGHHPDLLGRVRADRALLDQVIDETMRWLSPVQAATRYATVDQEILGVRVARGEMVNCMLAGANRDPRVFPDPDRFDIDRPNLRRHLGFATGPHLCLGFRLARAEALAALNALLDRFPDLRIVHARSSPPTGYEFRQPRMLSVTHLDVAEVEGEHEG